MEPAHFPFHLPGALRTGQVVSRAHPSAGRGERRDAVVPDGDVRALQGHAVLPARVVVGPAQHLCTEPPLPALHQGEEARLGAPGEADRLRALRHLVEGVGRAAGIGLRQPSLCRIEVQVFPELDAPGLGEPGGEDHLPARGGDPPGRVPPPPAGVGAEGQPLGLAFRVRQHQHGAGGIAAFVRVPLLQRPVGEANRGFNRRFEHLVYHRPGRAHQVDPVSAAQEQELVLLRVPDEVVPGDVIPLLRAAVDGPPAHAAFRQARGHVAPAR